MNKISKLFGSTLLMALAVTACSPEEFDGGSQNGIPSISGVEIQLNVDQEVNQASYEATGLQKGTYPIWVLDGKNYSTLSKATYSNSKAGAHTLELRVGNKNGFSQGSVSKEFTFNNTIIDFTPYINRISREWRINYAVAGHMGCGEPGTDGSNWWSAGPNEKADWGVYDDRITFTADGKYTYNPGEGGTVYVNKDVNAFSEFNTNDGNDYMAEVDEQNTTYSFDADGEKILLKLPANTLFPYLSSDAQYKDPVFTVSSLTNSDMVLLYEGNGITWRFVLTSKDESESGESGEEPTLDWDYDAASNLWKAVDEGSAFDAFGYYFAAGEDWHGISYNEATHNGDTYELTLPAENGEKQWQAQFHIDTKLTASASKAYNFFLVMEVDNDLSQATFKLTDSGDSNYFFEERIDVPAGKPFIFKREGLTLKEGNDASAIRMFFDFGGSPGGTNIKISKIYFEEAVVMNYDDADNLWKAVDEGSAFDAFGYYFAAGEDWHGIDFNEVTKTGNTYELTLPAENGEKQWQAQFHIDTKLTASASKAYNFQFDIESDYDLPQVTMKLTDAGDSNWFTEERNDVEGGAVRRFTWKGVKTHEGADATAIRLFFDFGGSPGGANVKISNIIFKEAQ